MTTRGDGPLRSTWDGRPPGAPDGWSGLVPVGPGDLDGDRDGVPDTLVVARARGGAWIFTDVDGDGFADVVHDIGGPDEDPDGSDDSDDRGPGVLDALVRLVTG